MGYADIYLDDTLAANTTQGTAIFNFGFGEWVFTSTVLEDQPRVVDGAFPDDALVWEDKRGLLHYSMPMRAAIENEGQG